MARDRTTLDQAIRQAAERGTFYWWFLEKRGKARRREYEVEVRVDVPFETFDKFDSPSGWTVVHTKPADGMIFIRRRQALRDADLRDMFAGMLSVAFDHNGRFHSWIHGNPDLQDWWDAQAD